MAVKRVQRLADLGELGLLDWVRKNMPSNVSGLIRGIGDDAAILRGGELVSTDLLIEGVHFKKNWQEPSRLGRKAMSVNLSDLAAMGGEPRCAFLGLAVKPNTPVREVQSFFSGFAAVAREHAMAVAGGDLSTSPGPMIISVTVVGRAERPVLRSGARTGDKLFVTGTIGDAALALKFLTRKKAIPGGRHFKFVQDRLFDPKPQIVLGRKISQFASAMIDLSDGLAVDLNNLCRESGVGAKVIMDRLPLSDAYRFLKARIKERNAINLYHEAIYGGEDYELLFTVPGQIVESLRPLMESLPLSEIGEIVDAAQGVTIETPKGPKVLAAEGDFSHFRS